MLKTPYYLIDKASLKANMEKIAYVRERSGAKALLALKCFATWSVFDLMQEYMDGTTSSSDGQRFRAGGRGLLRAARRSVRRRQAGDG